MLVQRIALLMSDNKLKLLVAIASLCIIGRTIIDFARAITPQPKQLSRQEQIKHVIRESCKQFKDDDVLYAKCWQTTRLSLQEKGIE